MFHWNHCRHVSWLSGTSRDQVSLGPKLKTKPSADRFQYHALYWKRYMRQMRSGDETRIKSVTDYYCNAQSLCTEVENTI